MIPTPPCPGCGWPAASVPTCPRCGADQAGYVLIPADPAHADGIALLLTNAGLVLPGTVQELTEALQRGPIAVGRGHPMGALTEVQAMLANNGVSASVEPMPRAEPAAPPASPPPPQRRPRPARREGSAPRRETPAPSGPAVWSWAVLALAVLAIGIGAWAFFRARAEPPAIADVESTGDPEAPPVSSAPTTVRLADSVVVLRSGVVEGTAFAVVRRGLFVTNQHVAAQDEVTLLANGLSQKGKVVRRASMGLDLALIECEPTGPVCDRPVLPLGRATKVSVADPVLAIGSPRGLDRTLTRGIISHEGRMHGLRMYLQTDLAVNPGNSGGPLVNAKGEVIGVVTAKLMRAEGIAFALPIEYALYGSNAILLGFADQQLTDDRFPEDFEAMIAQARNSAPIPPPPPPKADRRKAQTPRGWKPDPESKDPLVPGSRKPGLWLEDVKRDRTYRRRDRRTWIHIKFVLTSKLSNPAPKPSFRLRFEEDYVYLGKHRASIVREFSGAGIRESTYRLTVPLPKHVQLGRHAQIKTDRFESPIIRVTR